MESRNLAPSRQIATVFKTDLRRVAKERRTFALAAVQLLPVIAAVIFVAYGSINGTALYDGVIEGVLFPFLVPLVGIFYGGPMIVDEMESRTLTYLTLRPVSKPALYVGKWLAGLTLALALVWIPLVALYLICMIPAGTVGDGLASFGQTFLAAGLGVAAYSAIFAALGSFFSSSLVSGVIYYVLVELVAGSLPILELLSVRFHLRTTAGFGSAEKLGFLDQMILEEPLQVEWWISALVLVAFATLATVVGTQIFSEKQYHV